MAATESRFCPGLCSQLPQGHSRTLLPPGSGSQLPLAPIKQTYLLSGRENPSQKAALPRLVGWGGPRGCSACTWPPSASRASVPHRLPCNDL